MNTITPQNLIYHELIGLNITIANSTNPCQRGINGRITDETKNTFIIKTEKGNKQIAKKHNTFHFTLNENTISVCGDLLLSQPENRIKNKNKRLKISK